MYRNHDNPDGVLTRPKPWTEQEDAELYVRIERGEDFPRIAREMGRSLDATRTRAASVKGWSKQKMARGVAEAPAGVTLTRRVRDDPIAVVFAPIETSPEPEEQFLERVLRATDQEVAHLKAQRYVTVRIASDRPIGMSLSADWHLSARTGTDVRGLLAYADAVAETPGLYALAVGDMTDNPIKHKPLAVTDVPDDLKLLDILLQRFKGRLLGLTSGNHDDWTKAMVGVDKLQEMSERHQLHYAPDELIWLVEIADPSRAEVVTARWVIATRHQFRRHSNLNLAHACWRWLEDNVNNWPNDGKGATLLPDVVAIAHNHVAEVAHRSTERGTVIACRMGSWQYTSGFTRSKGYTLAPATAPTVILPNVRDGIQQPHAYERYQDAITALAAYTILPQKKK